MAAKTSGVKKIKAEPESIGYADYENSYALGSCSTDLNGDALSFAVDVYKSPPAKHTSSPAQEATRSRIHTCEVQLKKLYKQKSAGKLDNKGTMQIRCLEEDLRKAHAKLRRLLNEAERQRRRRERLRSGLSLSPSPISSGKMMIVRGSGRHGYDGLPTIASYGTHQTEMVTSGSHDDDGGIMAALKQSTRFDEFVKELNTLGFALNRADDESHIVYDLPEDGDEGNDGDVRVQVQLLEGEAALEQSMTVEEESEIQIIKPEPISPAPSSPINLENSIIDERLTGCDISSKLPTRTTLPSRTLIADYSRRPTHHKQWQEQYQDWYERQVENQRQWEENFMREQMELTKSMLENVTSTFLQGMQQVLQNVVGSVSRRSMAPFVPNFSSSSGLDLNGLTVSSSDLPLFINTEATNGPTVLSSRTMSDSN